LNAELATEKIRFYPGVSYRNLLVLSGAEFSADVKCDKPDDNAGQLVALHAPRETSPRGIVTAGTLRMLMAMAGKILVKECLRRKSQDTGQETYATLGANAIWPWSPGQAGAMKTLQERYGISGAVISAVDVIKGLGRCLGMEVINVPGATGYIDTNYEGKASAAIEAIKTHDLVYLHVEAIDEVSHAKDADMKIKAIEDFDSRIVAPVMAACGDAVRYVVLPDHPVPIATGKHTRLPVPVAVTGLPPDDVDRFDEVSAAHGRLGALFGQDLMNLLCGRDIG